MIKVLGLLWETNASFPPVEIEPSVPVINNVILSGIFIEVRIVALTSPIV